MKYDIYGRPEDNPSYRLGVPCAYEQDIPSGGGDGVYYIRFFNSAVCAVHRLAISTENGRTIVRREVAYGAWDDRATLTYSEINSNIETENE